MSITTNTKAKINDIDFIIKEIKNLCCPPVNGTSAGISNCTIVALCETENLSKLNDWAWQEDAPYPQYIKRTKLIIHGLHFVDIYIKELTYTDCEIIVTLSAGNIYFSDVVKFNKFKYKQLRKEKLLTIKQR